jgi:hypothetical protein
MEKLMHGFYEKLVELAVGMLPQHQRTRSREEWLSHLGEGEGRLFAFLHALGCLRIGVQTLIGWGGLPSQTAIRFYFHGVPPLDMAEIPGLRFLAFLTFGMGKQYAEFARIVPVAEAFLLATESETDHAERDRGEAYVNSIPDSAGPVKVFGFGDVVVQFAELPNELERRFQSEIEKRS